MKEDDPFAWAEKAEEDWELAKSILRRKKPFNDMACFHAQQCGEKYLKAILVAKGTAFPKTHDLAILTKLCESCGVLIGMETETLDTLSGFAARARYPSEDLSIEEAKEAFVIAKSIRKFARTWLGVKRGG